MISSMKFPLFLVVMFYPALASAESPTPTESAPAGAKASGTANHGDSSDCNCKGLRATAACTCVQGICQDYLGPNDLYFASSYPNNGDCGTYDDDLWYGQPSNGDRPQSCLAGRCEVFSGYDSTRVLPGHGFDLDDTNAWPIMKAAFDAAKKQNAFLNYQTHGYYQLPVNQNPPEIGTGQVTMLLVKVSVTNPRSTLKHSNYYLGLQVDTAGQIDSATFTNVSAGKGMQLKMTCNIAGDSRSALVWLK